jgi:hypothetical protein
VRGFVAQRARLEPSNHRGERADLCPSPSRGIRLDTSQGEERWGTISHFAGPPPPADLAGRRQPRRGGRVEPRTSIRGDGPARAPAPEGRHQSSPRPKRGQEHRKWRTVGTLSETRREACAKGREGGETRHVPRYKFHTRALFPSRHPRPHFHHPRPGLDQREAPKSAPLASHFAHVD